MTTYKKVITKIGKEIYFKDGKFTKDVPEAVKALESGQTLEADKIKEVVPTGHVSIISGEPATHQRYYNGNTYWVTKDEYENSPLGCIAYCVNKLDACKNE